jgi:hypothetical protein
VQQKVTESESNQGLKPLISTLLIITGAVTLLFLGAFLLKDKILNYSECEKLPGSEITSTYPKYCVTTDGRTVIYPGHSPYRGNSFPLRK